MSSREELGRRIRRARTEAGLSQGELGRLMTRQRTYAAVSDIERGKTALPVDELVEIARILDKDIDYFVGSEPTSSAVYRRGDQGLSTEHQRSTDRAIEQFKRLARERARQSREPER